MRILHVTPHLPPDQAANALLPRQLGQWAVEAGDQVVFVAHPARAGGSVPLPGPVKWIPRRRGGFVDRQLRLGSLTGAFRIWRAIAPIIEGAEIVHVHSNGLLAELAVLIARRLGKPVVLTLYGTEIWHYAPKRFGPDLFTRAYHAASAVTFYSDRLLTRAHELGLGRRGTAVIYPAVSRAFTWHDEEAALAVRARLGIGSRHMLVNVKRLHPLAGQRHLIEAMNEVIRDFPDIRLVICGTGALLDDLKTAARSAGVERHVVFAGLVDNTVVAPYWAAADQLVLPSLLEALPTVAVEALACGTPVVSTDNPGGVELNDVFGPDVALVPREQPLALAGAITHFLRHKRRTMSGTGQTLEREFRPEAVAAKYRQIYEDVRRGSA
jgi:glycosyltransferase involved in cell wall biosynthesis